MFDTNRKVNSTAMVAFLGLALFASGGCSHMLAGGGLRLKANRPQHVAVAVGEVALFAAVLAHVESEGWQVEEADRAAGRVVAVTPFEAGSGLITRERWIFTVGDRDLAVQKYLEAAEGDDPADVLDWESYDVVCSGYRYTSERAQLAGVAEQVQQSLARNP